jgi:hypothetical protein
MVKRTPRCSLAKTPSIKDLGTQVQTTAAVLPSHSTVTVTETERQTVTIPIVQTMTISTTVTPEPQKPAAKETATIVLHPIMSCINVPQASLIPRLPDIDYGYAFGYDDDYAQFYLETENSLLLRLPGVYRDATTSRPAVKISVSRDGKPIQVDLREWKKNDLAFVDWSPEETYGQLQVKVWTDSPPIFEEVVIIDYTESYIPSQYWGILEKSQRATWENLQRMGERMDALAKDIHSRVADPANYAAVEKQVSAYMRKAKQAQSELLDTAEQHYKHLKSHYPQVNLKDQTRHIKEQTRHIKEQTRQLTDQTREKVNQVLWLAQGEAIRLTADLKNRIHEKTPSKVEELKNYWKEKKAVAKDNRPVWYGKGRKQKHVDRVSKCGKKKGCK